MTKGDYVYPEWADAIGWIIAVPVAAVYEIGKKVFFEYKDIQSYRQVTQFSY